MKIRLVILGALLALLAGCATSPTGRHQLMLVSPEQVQQMGINAFQEMGEKGKFADAPEKQQYATCVADNLIDVLPEQMRNQDWKIRIVDEDEPNAFALPGGRIGVNRGMFDIATNQDQLAVVLGHELAHVVAHHPAERISQHEGAKLGVLVGTAVGASNGINPNALQSLLGMGSKVALLPFSRTQESEADKLGQKYMAEAGFDPHAATTLWRKMQEDSGNAPPTFLSTHPSPDQRISALSKGASRLKHTYEKARRSGHTPNCHM